MSNNHDNIKYCLKCGDMYWTDSDICRTCGNHLCYSDNKYELIYGNNIYINGKSINTGRTFKQNQQRLFEEVIKPNPEFDPDLYARKDEIIKQKQEQEMNEFRRQTGGVSWVDDKIGNKPKCPTCGSTNIKPITTGERIGSITMFGIFSKKINKSFKCLDCKYTW